MKNTFRYNKKRKHYAYIFKAIDGYCSNILITTKSQSLQKKKGKSIVIKNVRLFRHPNPNESNLVVFIYNHPPYRDPYVSFENKKLKWSWDINDKRKIKRFKKYKKYKNILPK